MKNQYDFEFKKVVNHKGLYCRVVIEIDEIDEGLELLFTDKNCDSWINSINFAVDYYLFFFSQKNKKGLKVNFLLLKTFEIDSTQALVFYCVIKALDNFMKVIPDDFCISQDTGNLSLPLF